MTHPLLEHNNALVNPAPNTPVFTLDRARPGATDADVPRFADPIWNLAALRHGEATTTLSIVWENFPVPLRPAFMRAAWALLNLPTPLPLMADSRAATREHPAAATLTRGIRTWSYFARWLESRSVRSLDEITRDLMTEYAAERGALGTCRTVIVHELFSITRLWAFAPFLLPEDRIPMPPWEDAEVGGTGAYADGLRQWQQRGENTTAPIHPSVVSPLLVWALRMVTDFAPDILSARGEMRRLLDNASSRAEPGGRDKIRTYFRRLEETGEPAPGFNSPRIKTLQQAHRHRTGSPPPPLPSHNQYIAGLLGVSVGQVNQLVRSCLRDSDRLTTGDGAPLATEITGSLDGRPWRGLIDFEEVQDLAEHLMTAALIVIAYLSGIRPQEVLQLQRGCCTTEHRSDGTIRHRITGRHFKTVTDSRGNQIPQGALRAHPWTVIAPVQQAVTVLEDLTDGELLFPRSLSKCHKPRTYLGSALTPALAIARIRRFSAWSNELARHHGRDHEAIPDDPEGAVTLRRFRRTIAWFIVRRPSGRIALGIQYGHLSASLADGYGGRSTTDMLQLLDLEQALATAETLATAAERLTSGEGVSGPAVGRYITAASEFQTTYAGGFLSKRQHKALIANPHLQVFDHPESFLTCNYDPHAALCNPARGGADATTQRTPSHSRCRSACPNISRTDTHMDLAAKEIEQLSAEISDGLLPHPIRQRLQQRQQALDALIEAHRSTRTTTGEGAHV
ncbi:hypothetical protein [Streptomyces sp. AP-93]|uniref:hypothetical protein n=1 Tax=Streptomyces sp. AP-93 TaxID=2929048 RepID=UPI001FAF93BB|nr:hypothetical protein [Streptomyces sp. AP-93]MCJ0875514.1 hypothetical protein [Streptomyces sp. AP-93]